ncbi:hypothetical protein D3C77_440110 [compost metagenome]
MSALFGNPLPHVTTKAGFPWPIPANIIRVVARAIQHAWEEIQSDPSAHLVGVSPGAPEEDVYSDALCNMLLQMLDMENPLVPGFSSESFDTVCRGENLPNYSGALLNKQPDLIIRLANSPLAVTRRLVGIFIESKVVCMKNPINLYTTHGLSRFVGGDYGWAMQAGMMLAYQKGKHRPITHLEAQLAAEVTLCSIAVGSSHLESRTEYHPISAVSSHKRSWNYQDGGTPGDIRIWHMWDLETLP